MYHLASLHSVTDDSMMPLVDQTTCSGMVG